MARINKGGHVVLAVRDPEVSAKFYVEALGMELTTFMPEFQMAFLSFGTRDHDIALIKAPEGAPLGSQGLSHTALEIEGGEEELRQLYRRLLGLCQVKETKKGIWDMGMSCPAALTMLTKPRHRSRAIEVSSPGPTM